MSCDGIRAGCVAPPGNRKTFLVETTVRGGLLLLPHSTERRCAAALRWLHLYRYYLLIPKYLAKNWFEEIVFAVPIVPLRKFILIVVLAARACSTALASVRKKIGALIKKYVGKYFILFQIFI